MKREKKNKLLEACKYSYYVSEYNFDKVILYTKSLKTKYHSDCTFLCRTKIRTYVNLVFCSYDRSIGNGLLKMYGVNINISSKFGKNKFLQ